MVTLHTKGMALMAIYEFICRECAYEDIVDTPIDKGYAIPICIECSKPMYRKYQATAAIFKGRGWGAKP